LVRIRSPDQTEFDVVSRSSASPKTRSWVYAANLNRERFTNDTPRAPASRFESTWTPEGHPWRSLLCNCLRNLVGLPRFELGTPRGIPSVPSALGTPGVARGWDAPNSNRVAGEAGRYRRLPPRRPNGPTPTDRRSGISPPASSGGRSRWPTPNARVTSGGARDRDAAIGNRGVRARGFSHAQSARPACRASTRRIGDSSIGRNGDFSPGMSTRGHSRPPGPFSQRPTITRKGLSLARHRTSRPKIDRKSASRVAPTKPRLRLFLNQGGSQQGCRGPPWPGFVECRTE
jgi:hypothetical protein